MLSEIAPGLHAAETTMRFPGGVVMPLRMTVVRNAAGGLTVHSPIAPEPALLEAVQRLGRVEQILAPSLGHHLSVGAWLDRFPAARAYGAIGLAAKRPDVRWSGVLDGGDGPWSDVLDQVLLEGAPKWNEVAFRHRESGTLIVSDLLFHMIGPQPLATRLVLKLAGTEGKLAMSRVWRLITKDRAALRKSVATVLAWDFQRILPGHGAVFEAPDANPRARAALAWALG